MYQTTCALTDRRGVRSTPPIHNHSRGATVDSTALVVHAAPGAGGRRRRGHGKKRTREDPTAAAAAAARDARRRPPTPRASNDGGRGRPSTAQKNTTDSPGLTTGQEAHLQVDSTRRRPSCNLLIYTRKFFFFLNINWTSRGLQAHHSNRVPRIAEHLAQFEKFGMISYPQKWDSVNTSAKMIFLDTIKFIL